MSEIRVLKLSQLTPNKKQDRRDWESPVAREHIEKLKKYNTDFGEAPVAAAMLAVIAASRFSRGRTDVVFHFGLLLVLLCSSTPGPAAGPPLGGRGGARGVGQGGRRGAGDHGWFCGRSHCQRRRCRQRSPLSSQPGTTARWKCG